MSTLKYEWRKYLKEMRTDGFAVVFITPDTLKGIDPSAVEQHMITSAKEFIEGESDD